MIQILKKNPELRHEKDLNFLVPIIREIEFFKSTSIQTHHMVDVCQELRYECMQPGEFVFYQGDYGDKFYIILKGKVQVLVNNTEYKKSTFESNSNKHPGKKGSTNTAASNHA
jgi:Cyclic nucleotide-binding domain